MGKLIIWLLAAGKMGKLLLTCGLHVGAPTFIALVGVVGR